MRLIAHRGDTTKAPENTMEAFQAAYDAKVFGMEFDVRLSADSVPMIFHHMQLSRTNAKGFLEDYTYEELQAIPIVVNDNTYRIPCLEDVLSHFGGYLYLEIHVQSYSRDAVNQISKILQNYPHTWNKMEITSYEPAMLLAFREACKAIPTDYLFKPESWMSEEIALRLILEKAKLAQARGIHLFHEQISEPVLSRFAKQGFVVHCGVVNELEAFKRVLGLGVEQILTDNIHLYL